ncbi:hypothetical protein RFI_39458 [Reticulomyxa filosa]|uniref:Uncharacterized protein n=1 Tax=Reticulomyxa filosa TaxID=46433 RepID=X6LBF4_RETFI|nr:hypothetical protein RFI_39458 [Reticulomyxa filosa]|eukprot:ETN98064.1 hypothetical protein RFI_39458 [Reticulomyxa filosa]
MQWPEWSLFFGRANYSDFIILWRTYTFPKVIHVWLYEGAIQIRRIDYDVIKVGLDHNDRAICKDETRPCCGNGSFGKFVIIFFYVFLYGTVFFKTKKKSVMYSYIEKVKEGGKKNQEIQSYKYEGIGDSTSSQTLGSFARSVGEQMLYIVLELVKCGELFNKIS